MSAATPVFSAVIAVFQPGFEAGVAAGLATAGLAATDLSAGASCLEHPGPASTTVKREATNAAIAKLVFLLQPELFMPSSVLRDRKRS